MANTIDAGQPLRNPRPSAPLSQAQESAAPPKDRGPLGPDAQAYLQLARQDVADIRQLGAPAKP